MDESINTMISKNFIWGLIGIIVGLIVNNLSIKLSKILYLKSKHYQIILQLLLCSTILPFISIYIHPKFGWSWQNEVSGLFFVSFFFGVQFMAFDNLQKISIR